ncbi:hypothetical protein GW931_00020 [archaeon]|nr:hypothetical protein [archaeon]PJC45347.1 MAG: hypothetical protein CO037_02010 [Candidatus Pacearchaeota archaeon CG_4_9_14_0_2_um_filter_30_8]
MKFNKKIILYVFLGILILGLLIFTFFPNMTYAIRDFGKSGSNEDICQPPAGTTLEEWQTHMSHHPNIYAGCLS